MSALAKYFNAKHISISGYDKTPTPLTLELESMGMKIHYEDNIQLIDKDAGLVIYTPAIPKDHTELAWYRSNNYQVLKRSEVLEKITSDTYNICIAGTHGKTTISSMIAHILHHSGYGCTAFLGGISVNYNSNFISGNDKLCVIEADEYDRSFLRLDPDVAIISAMDPDHLDIYGSADKMQQAFIDFSGKIKAGGLLISKYGLARTKELHASKHITYSMHNDVADAYAANITMSKGSYRFDVMQPDWMLSDVTLNMGGMHNVENAVAAISVAHYLKIGSDKIKNAVSSFKGVKRRFEYIIPPADSGVVYIDDYAHHPEELKALINGAKGLFSEKKCTLIFQPHLFSRTRDLADEFAKSLDLADEVILLPIYPAREQPVEGVSSRLIFDRMRNDRKQILNEAEMLSWLGLHQPELLITAGAGDIDQLIEPIKKILTGNK